MNQFWKKASWILGGLVSFFTFIFVFSHWPVYVVEGAVVLWLIYTLFTKTDGLITIGGKTIHVLGFTAVFLAAFVLFQMALSLIFDARLLPLYQQVNQHWWSVFAPKLFFGNVAKQFMVLVLALLMAGGYARSKKRFRWHVIGGMICVVGLICQATYVALPASQQQQITATRLATSSTLCRWITVKIQGAGTATERDSYWNALANAMPEEIRLHEGVYLRRFKDGQMTTTNQTVSGETFYLRRTDEVEFDERTGVPYVPVAYSDNRDAENWWVCYTDIELNEPEVEEDQLLIVAPVPSESTTVSQPVPLSPPVILATLPSSPVVDSLQTFMPEEPPIPPPINHDAVTITTTGWTDSAMVPYDGTRIEFGPFDSREDVERILVRSGAADYGRLTPLTRYDGSWFARGNFHGENLDHAPIRLQLSQGDPLLVEMARIN